MDAWSNEHLSIKFKFNREGDVLSIHLDAGNVTLGDQIDEFIFQGKNTSL